MVKIIAVCKSEGEGIKKEDVIEGFFEENYDLVGEAHANCCIHR